MRHILTQIQTVCYLSDHGIIQSLSHRNRPSRNLYRTTHIVTNPITLYYTSITFWHTRYPTTFRYVSHLILTHIPTELLTDPCTFYYRSDHILLQIREYFFTYPSTFCKHRIDMDLWNSGNGCFDPILGQLYMPALFSIVGSCTLQGTVPI